MPWQRKRRCRSNGHSQQIRVLVLLQRRKTTHFHRYRKEASALYPVQMGANTIARVDWRAKGPTNLGGNEASERRAGSTLPFWFLSPCHVHSVGHSGVKTRGGVINTCYGMASASSGKKKKDGRMFAQNVEKNNINAMKREPGGNREKKQSFLATEVVLVPYPDTVSTKKRRCFRSMRKISRRWRVFIKTFFCPRWVGKLEIYESRCNALTRSDLTLSIPSLTHTRTHVVQNRPCITPSPTHHIWK
ncbi:hypothetical protein BC827DRAFT_844218 [Russula dissimulans]|nr:hypothetical protein BC827DRAFT_844218 [Russula dissimulans]